jgi:hypothetical protein
MFSEFIYPLRRPFIFLILAALVLSACGAPQAPSVVQQVAVEKAASSAGGAPPAPMMEAPAQPQASGVAQDGSNQAIERIVIKNGSLTIVVPDPVKSIDTISKMAEEMQGYVVSSNLYKEYANSGAEVPRGSITIRVPAERMLEAMQRIKAESKEAPDNENITSQDVTNEYVDLQSQLKNLEAAEAELTEIMKSATKTEDVMAVYDKLVQIRGQIDVIKGQIKYYDQAAALSAISVELIADAAVQPIEIGGWQPSGVLKDAVEALVKTMQGLVNALIWIVIYVLPVLLALFLIFVLPIYLIVRGIRRRGRAKKAIVTPPPAE